MTLTCEWHIHCDRCGESDGPGHACATESEAIGALKERGWLFDGDSTICWACADRPAEEPSR